MPVSPFDRFRRGGRRSAIALVMAVMVFTVGTQLQPAAAERPGRAIGVGADRNAVDVGDVAGQARRDGIDVDEVVRSVSHRMAPGRALTVSESVSGIGPERPVSEVVPSNPAGNQDEPDVAFDGTNYFVVWNDSRSGSDATPDIFGARVTRDGVVLDPVGIPLVTGIRPQFAPTVAFDGANFLIAFSENQGTENDVHGIRVDRSGRPVGGNFVIATGPGDQYFPSVAFDGTNFLVAWWYSNLGDSRSDVYGARVSRTGAVLDPTPIAISVHDGGSDVPAVAFDGTNYLVVWIDGRVSGDSGDIFGARVSPAGVVLDPDGIPIAAGPGLQYAPDVAFNGTSYLAVWNELQFEPFATDIRGARISPAGVVLDGGGIAITSGQDSEDSPSVGSDGTNFLVAWGDFRRGSTSDIFGARVSEAGTVLDPAGIAIARVASSQTVPAVGFGGGDFLVAWAGAPFDLAAARVSPAGVVRDPDGIALTGAANDQTDPAVAFDGTNYFVVWADVRAGAEAVYGARVAPDGTILDGSGILLGRAAGFASAPAVTFGGTGFLVTWVDHRGGPSTVFGARVAPDGTVLDPNGISISTGYEDVQEPAVAFDGTNYLAVWTDRRDGAVSGYDVFGARVSQAGDVLDLDGITISSAADDQATAALAFDGTRYLVVWSDPRSGSGRDIYGARVTPAGAVLEPAGIPISTTANDQVAPAVAFDGTRYLVAWSDGRTTPVAPDIYATRVTRAGGVVTPAGVPVSTAPGSQDQPSVVANGPFLVVWRDDRSGNPDVYGSRVTGAGAVVDPAGMAIATGPGDDSDPTATGGPGNRWGVVSQRFAAEAPYGANRAFLRTVSPK